ncbi:putative RNA-directed DNA polymerase [Tanacetum coccineum]|uniref:RNA-directed DNA polymerase n=1 Tax=Tanacetum coccineum TaxID=301880 RepID=A0ABQ4Y7N0_9ASTR
MRQCICHTDHNLWDVIVNGYLEEKPAPTGDQFGPSAPSAPRLPPKINYAARILSGRFIGAQISRKISNQKFHRSWLLQGIDCLIMRNKPDIDEIDIDDLYNNLRVYEDELKRSSGSNSASQNLAFLSFENTGGTNEVSTASGDFGVSTASGINQVPSTPCAHDVAMLTVRIECYNCHKKGHIARECRSGRNQRRRSYGDNGRSNAPINESSSQALVAQDGLRGYDWSNDFKVKPVNYALMAISSSSSSSSSDSEVQKCSKKCLESFKTLQKNYDTEREKHNKAKLEIRGYEIALESLESRILRHEKNELVWGEKYEFQNYELKCREIKVNNLNLELEKVVKERDELKDKIAKWKESTKNLDGILNNQMSARDKNGLDEYAIRNKIIESQTTELNTKTSETTGQTNDANTKKPKSVSEAVVSNPKINRDRVIIEDWNSNDEEEEYEVQTVRLETQTVKTRNDKVRQSFLRKQGIGFKKVKACFVCKSTEHLIKDCNFHAKKSQEPKLKNVVNTGQREGKLVWDNTKGPSVSTASPVCTVLRRPNRVSTARPICTAKPSVSTALGIVSMHTKTYFIPRMDNVMTKRLMLSLIKRPNGNYLDHVSKDSGSFMLKKGNLEILLQDHAVVDSGCSSHMTSNKAYLSDFEDFNGGFVAFGNEHKFNLFFVSQMCDKKNSVLFTKSECLILSPSFKLLNESQVVLRAPRKDDVYNLDLKNIVPSGDHLDLGRNNDNSSLAIVNIKLVGAENYKIWAMALKIALKGENKMGFIDGTCVKQATSVVLSQQWERCNAIVLGWILGSLSQELYVGQVYSEIASEVWNGLKETYDKMEGSVVFNLMHKSNNLRQGDLYVPDYYHKLNSIWREFDILTVLPACPIRSNILAKDPLPNVKDAFYVVSREESHRGLHPCNYATRPNPNLLCKNYGLISHTIERCYEIIGFLAGFKRNPNLSRQTGNNTNKRFNANSEVNHSVPGTSGSISSSFTNEQMVKLLSFINEKPTPAANMSDVSSLLLTIGHPNGTLAMISAIGSLRLTSGIVLFDVLVVTEYNVSLLYVNKMIKDSKFFVGFDEHKCYIQDLNLGKLVGTGSVTGGLYLFDLDKIGKSASSNSVFVCHVSSKLWHCRLGHPTDQVLSILGKKLGFSKIDHQSPCDICHKAKQTNEPFPLCDHKSKSVGDIVHCDVWGPYRVISKDGFKFFLTIVDDYSRAVWVYLLKSKTEVGEYIESFIKLVFTQFGKKVKIVRSDNETEFVNHHLSNFFKDLGIIHQNSCAYTPQQNGVAERKHRHLLNVARSLMFQGGIPLSMWPECILTAIYPINRLPSSVLSGVSPYVLVYVDDDVAKDATHIEDNATFEGNVPINQNGEGYSSPIGVSPELRRSTRPKVMPARFNDFVVNSSVRYEAAQNPKWIEAMNLEMEAFLEIIPMFLLTFHLEGRLLGVSGCRKLNISPLVRCLIALSIKNSWPLYQIDMNNAFVYGDLKEDVYMELPLGYYDKDETRVCKLVKSLYGLKQAPRQWNEKLTTTLIEHGFVQSKNDYSLFIKDKNGVFIAILFMIKDLGQLKYFLGIEVLENMNGLCLNQRKYCLELLSEYGLLACKPAATPLQQNVVLGYEESENDKFLPSMTNQHMHAPLPSHFSAALRVLMVLEFSFISKIVSVFMVFQMQTGLNVLRPENLCLVIVCTCAIILYLGKVKSKQPFLGVEGLLPVNLYCDSSSAISIARNPVFHEKTKHFEIDLHLVRDKVADGVVKVLKVASASNVADVFTKGLSIVQHNEFCSKLNLVDMFKP